MKNLKLIYLLIILLFIVSACQTVKDKTDAIVKKENQKLGKYIGKTWLEKKNKGHSVQYLQNEHETDFL